MDHQQPEGGRFDGSARSALVAATVKVLGAQKLEADETDVREVLSLLLSGQAMKDVSGVIDILLKFGQQLAKAPAARYRDAGEVVAALAQALDQPLLVETVATRESFLQAAPLVGRRDELVRLTAVVREARRGNGGACLVAGESGVGKSRLLDEIRTRAATKTLEGRKCAKAFPSQRFAAPYARPYGILKRPGKASENPVPTGTVPVRGLRQRTRVGRAETPKPKTPPRLSSRSLLKPGGGSGLLCS